MEYFTADPHFGHRNIIQHCQRPFDTVEEMDATIISRWNEVLKPGDRLFILGDFCGQRRKADMIKSYVDRIHLHPDAFILILGNHDKKTECRKVFEHVHDLYTFRFFHGSHRQRIILCHYRMAVWSSSCHGAWHLWGHSHSRSPEVANRLLNYSFDCGVDAWGFKLLSLDDVIHIMTSKPRQVDNHYSETLA